MAKTILIALVFFFLCLPLAGWAQNDLQREEEPAPTPVETCSPTAPDPAGDEPREKVEEATPTPYPPRTDGKAPSWGKSVTPPVVLNPQGQRGFSGRNGMDGRNGIDGNPGPRGPQGLQGPKGPMGEKGERGPIGPQGPDAPLKNLGSLDMAGVIVGLIAVSGLIGGILFGKRKKAARKAAKK